MATMTDLIAVPFWQQGADKLSADVRKIVLEVSGLAFRDFLHKASESLISYGEKSSAGSDLADLHYTSANIRADLDRMVRIFVRRLEASFNRKWSSSTGSGADGAHSGGQLALVADDVIEEHIVLAAIQQKAETLFNDYLWALSQRFALLQGGAKTPADKLPMAPASYCEALQDAVSSINISLPSRLYIFKLFDRWWLPQMDGIYQRINALLKNCGVLPNLPLRLEQRGSEANSAVESLRADDGGAADEDSGQQLLRDIDQLQNHLIVPPEVPTEYSVDQLLQAADQLQRSRHASIGKIILAGNEMPIQDFHADNGQLTHYLQQVMDAESSPQLILDDVKIVDLVGKLFEFVLKDETLPACVRATLSFLHTPYLKIAFADAGFFQQQQHPARQLLNVLAAAGSRWVDSDGSSEFHVYQQIQQTVWRVLEDFEQDVKLIARLLMEFNGYLQKVELRVHLLERRATEKARGEDRLRQVKLRVNKELHQRMQGRDLPPAIMFFFLQPWTDYMVLLLLRYGDKSEPWRQALGLIEDLLWGLESSGDSDDLARWQQHFPSVEATMQKGFETIDYDRGKGRRLIQAISRAYEQYASNDQVEAPSRTLAEKLQRLAERRLREVSQDAQSDTREQEMLEQLCQMDFDTWFEFQDGRREKVTWFSYATKRFLFVDRSGRQTRIRKGLELARGILAGDVRMIADTAKPLLDRALESICDELNEQVRSHATF